MSDSKYYRTASPPRTKRTQRSDSYTPKTVMDKGGVIPISTETYPAKPSRGSAYSGSVSAAYSGRQRRGTLDGADGAAAAKPRTVVTHGQPSARPASPLRRGNDRDSAYVTSSSSSSYPKREHKRMYSVDDSGNMQSIYDLPSTVDPHVRNMDSWGTGDRDRAREKRDHPRDRDRKYHLTGPSSGSSSRRVDDGGTSSSGYNDSQTIDDSAYGYTDPAGMYRDTEPRWRQRKGSVDGRSRDRPISMLDPGSYQRTGDRASRDAGPPPVTRGLEKVKQGVERGGSVRETRERAPSRDDPAPNLLSVNRGGALDVPDRPSSTRPPTDAGTQREQRLPADQRQPYRRDTWDERDYRDRSREPRPPERKWTDSNVTSRGFGIRSGSASYGRSSDEESPVRRITYPSPSPSRKAEPLRAPTISDYVPSSVLNEPAPAPRHHRRRASEREDYRDRYAPSGDHLDVRPPEGAGSRHNSASSDAGLGAVAGVAAGAYAANRMADDRERDRRVNDHDDDDDRLRRAPRGAPDDVDRPRRRRSRSAQDDYDDRPRDRLDERPAERRDQDRDRDRNRDLPPDEPPRRQASPEEMDPDEEYRRRVQQASAELAGMDPLSRSSTREDEYAGAEKRTRRRDRARDRDRDLVSEPRGPQERRSGEDMSGALPPRGSREDDHDDVDDVNGVRSSPPTAAVDPRASLGGSLPLAPTRGGGGDDYHNQRSSSFFSDSAVTQEPQEMDPAVAAAGGLAAAGGAAALVAAGASSSSSNHAANNNNNNNHADYLDPDDGVAHHHHQQRRARSRSSPSPSSKDSRVRIVEPPREEKDPAPLIRGILKKPTQKFPEDPNPVREGVTTTKDPKRDGRARKEGIPSDARWTKIDRSWVNPQALEEAGERFEERMDCVIVLRVLTKDEIQKYADRTRQIRDEREGRHSSRRHHNNNSNNNDEDDAASSNRHRRGNKDRDRDDRRERRDRRRDRGGGATGDNDSEDEEYERMRKERADLERSLGSGRREKERPRMLEAGHDR